MTDLDKYNEALNELKQEIRKAFKIDKTIKLLNDLINGIDKRINNKKRI